MSNDQDVQEWAAEQQEMMQKLSEETEILASAYEEIAESDMGGDEADEYLRNIVNGMEQERDELVFDQI